MKKATNKQY